MSSTRYASDGVMRQNRYASDPVYNLNRGVQGLAVAAKASLLCEEKKRGLLYFLQSLSLEKGGLNSVAREIIDQFKDQVGTETSRAKKIKAGTLYAKNIARIVRMEMEGRERYEINLLADDDGETVSARPSIDGGAILEGILGHARKHLPGYLTELCVNPYVEIELSDDQACDFKDIQRDCFIDEYEWNGPVESWQFKPAKVPYLEGLCDTLFAYKAAYERRALNRVVKTTVTNQVFEALDYSLKAKKMVLIQGIPGVGKTESVKAWCDAHRGQVRMVSLSAFNNRTCFISEIARSLGVASTSGYSTSKVQAKVEAFLKQTKLMLVIDEAQYLWPMGERLRAYRQPELINWINTACWNRGIPVALVGTEDFAKRREMIEIQTKWSSEQLNRRVRRVFILPNQPSLDDMAAVVRHMVPGVKAPLTKFIVGYCTDSKRYLTGINDVVDDARIVAEANGRTVPIFDDFEYAIMNIRAESDAAQQRVFAPDRTGKKGRKDTKGTEENPNSRQGAEDMQNGCKEFAGGLRGVRGSLGVRPGDERNRLDAGIETGATRRSDDDLATLGVAVGAGD